MSESEYAIRLSAYDAEISAALLAYENAFDTGDRRDILRTWKTHTDLEKDRNRYVDVETARRQQVA